MRLLITGLLATALSAQIFSGFGGGAGTGAPAPAANGFQAWLSTSFVARSLQPGTGIIITNANGVAGNPIISIDGGAVLQGTTVQAGALIYAAGAGTGTAQTATLSPALGAYSTGMQVLFRPSVANTGALTLNLGPSAVAVLSPVGAPLVAGQLEVGPAYWLFFDGAAFRVVAAFGTRTVFGRTGDVVGTESDYQAFYPRLSQTYADPAWIGSLAFAKTTGLVPLGRLAICAEGQIPKISGGAWVCAADGGGGGGTDASALITGTVAAARGGAGTVNGLLKANGAGTVSAAVAGVDYQLPGGGATFPCAPTFASSVGTVAACDYTSGRLKITPNASPITTTVTSAIAGGSIWFGFNAAGVAIAAHNLTTVTCSGCTALGGQTDFPSDVVFRVATWTVNASATITAQADHRSVFSADTVIGINGVAVSRDIATGVVTISGPGAGGGGGQMKRTVITASGTWTKPATVARVFVRVWAGGSGGKTGASGEPGGGGGSGGGMAQGWCEVSADVAVTIGAGGAGGVPSGSAFLYNDGGDGGDSSFGGCLVALGARSAGTLGRSSGAPGYRSGANAGPYYNGDAARPGAITSLLGTGATTIVTTLTGSQFGFNGVDGAPGFHAAREDQGAAGGSGTASSGTAGGWAIGGGAGGGAGASGAGSLGFGGISQLGGNGGSGGGSGIACTAGSIPGGGGGGGSSVPSKQAGCAGARGEVHVYYVE
jgi:hypothetical protein